MSLFGRPLADGDRLDVAGAVVRLKVHTRARICDSGDHAARASGLPRESITSTVSPGRARPSSRSTEPAKIHGCRRCRLRC